MKKGFAILACVLMSLCVFSPAFAYDNVTPQDTYAMMNDDPNVYILDVRTDAEWKWVGHPGKDKLGDGPFLEGKVVNIAYMIDKKGVLVVNPSFVSDVEEMFEKSATLILMCRSGQRSVAGALALEAAGFTSVYNMLQGFEGGTDQRGYRTVNGWKVGNLPYNYSGVGAYPD